MGGSVRFSLFRFGLVCCLCIALSFSLAVLVMASDDPLTDTSAEVTEPDPEQATDDIGVLYPVNSQPVEVNITVDRDDETLQPIDLTVVGPVTPNNTNAFKSVLVALIGNYDPVVVEYAYQSSQGYTSYVREIQPDYVWLCSCAILLVVLYCVFRLIGGIICGRT